MKRTINSPTGFSPVEKEKRTTAPVKQCPRCLTTIGRGKPHTCTPTTQTKNFKLMAEQFPRSAEQVASFIVKKKEASPGGTKKLSQFSGPLSLLFLGFLIQRRLLVFLLQK
jgi:hypothetical protein